MTYQQSLEYLDSLLKFGIKFGLERISALAAAFGDPHKQLRVIHVAGTNGKGSTCTFIASILREAGYRTGLYLSPYVFDVRERIQVDGKYISEEEFAELASEIKLAADKIGQTELGPVTEFEVKTMMAYLYFVRKGVDFAVLEVGMGGRFDATNIVSPLVSVITSISLDHTDRLGDTVEKIAFEKAGIIKNGSMLVTAVDDDAAWRVILDRSRQEGVEIWRVMSSHARHPSSPSADVQFRYSTKGDSFSLSGGEMKLIGLKPSLIGAFQHANAATAAVAIKALERYEVRITSQAIAAGIANAAIPGRMQVLRNDPTVVIDGAHNPDAAAKLARAITERFSYDRLILVIGMTNSHSPQKVLRKLAPLANKVIVTQSQWFKATPSQQIADVALKMGADVEVVEPVTEAAKHAIKIANPRDLVLITGSFYTIGEVNTNNLK
ncbi:MAG: bifunctional folylpolyglutamate synthase/dihydrofolate synthase [Armatimonadota bacterium]|jgi:dihydrofolate synthase/folylpolyglutamate synthase